MEYKIVCDGVVKSYSTRKNGDNCINAIDNLSLAIRESEIFTLVGPTGCGKTSTLNLIAGFEFPSAGSIAIDGVPVTCPGPDRAVVFQQASLFPWLTVLGNVTLGVKSQGMPRSEYTQRAETLLNAVGLTGFEDSYPYQLSGGMQQRTQIARALISNPRVLLMDEPFGALDYQTRIAMQLLVLELSNKFRPTIFFITHDVSEAIFISDRVAVMSRRPGRIKSISPVNIPKPRTLDVITSPEFTKIQHDVLISVQEESLELIRAQQ